MFQIASKGDQNFVDGTQEIGVSLEWSSAVDFDLFAVYQAKDNPSNQGIVWGQEGQMGSDSSFPFIVSSGDEGADDDAGGVDEKSEELTIVRPSAHSYIWLGVWDYQRVLNGQPGRFGSSDMRLVTMDQQGENQIPLVGLNGNENVALIATVDSSGGNTKVVNCSAGTLQSIC